MLLGAFARDMGPRTTRERRAKRHSEAIFFVRADPDSFCRRDVLAVSIAVQMFRSDKDLVRKKPKGGRRAAARRRAAYAALRPESARAAASPVGVVSPMVPARARARARVPALRVRVCAFTCRRARVHA